MKVIKNVIFIVIFVCMKHNVHAFDPNDLEQLCKQSEIYNGTGISKSSAFERLLRTTTDEIININKTFTSEQRKRYYDKLSHYARKNLLDNIQKRDFSTVIDMLELQCVLSYLSNHTYLQQEHIVKGAYALFFSPYMSQKQKTKLLSILQHRLIKPNLQNYREYAGANHEIVLFANKLIHNYFCITIMDILAKENVFENIKRNFIYEIKKISSQLNIDNSVISVDNAKGILEFYWILKHPVGFLYASPDVIIYKISRYDIDNKRQTPIK